MNNQHLYLRSSNNIDHINLLLIGFAKPKLFSPRVKNFCTHIVTCSPLLKLPGKMKLKNTLWILS